MPIYEYKCKTCGNVFEYQQRITEDSLKKCPNEICKEEIKGNGDVERIISKNVGLVFKGSGFYLTDYAKKNVSLNSNSDSINNESKKVITESTTTKTTENSEK